MSEYLLKSLAETFLFWFISFHAILIFSIIPLSIKTYNDILNEKNKDKVLKSPQKIPYKIGNSEYEDYIYLKLGSTLMDDVWKIYAGKSTVHLSSSYRRAKKQFDKIIKENKFNFNSEKYFI
jgi:hypothetical protein